MKRIGILSGLGILLMAIVIVLSVGNHQKTIAQTPPAPSLEGFILEKMEFGPYPNKPKPTAAPKIPKDWRFVGVTSPGAHTGQVLWFQDAAGNVYMLRGSPNPVPFGVYQIDQEVDELPVAN